MKITRRGPKKSPNSIKWSQRGRKWSEKGPKGSQKGAKGSQREPKGSQREPKGSLREPKGFQKGAKGSQRATKMLLKIDVRERSRKRSEKGTPPESATEFFGSQNGPFFMKNPEKTPSKKQPKIDTEKVEKMREKQSKNGSQNRWIFSFFFAKG